MEQKITVIEIIPANRKRITNEIKQVCNRDMDSCKVFCNKPETNIVLNSFVVNSKTIEKRNILILSTIHKVFKLLKDQKKKPDLYKFFDYTTRGTDIVHQKISFYSSKSKSRKWTAITFPFLLIHLSHKYNKCISNKHRHGAAQTKFV